MHMTRKTPRPLFLARLKHRSKCTMLFSDENFSFITNLNDHLEKYREKIDFNNVATLSNNESRRRKENLRYKLIERIKHVETCRDLFKTEST